MKFSICGTILYIVVYVKHLHIGMNNTNMFIFYFWLLWVFVALCGLSPGAESRGYSPVAVHGLLIGMASLVAEHRF